MGRTTTARGGAAIRREEGPIQGGEREEIRLGTVRTLQEPGSRGRGRPTERDGRARGQKRKVRGARDAIPNPKWSWILWILCLWRALQMGAALVLKGRGVLLLRVAVRQLTRSGPLLRETILRQRENQDRQWDPSQDAGGRVQHPPAGPRGALLGRRL